MNVMNKNSSIYLMDKKLSLKYTINDLYILLLELPDLIVNNFIIWDDVSENPNITLELFEYHFNTKAQAQTNNSNTVNNGDNSKDGDNSNDHFHFTIGGFCRNINATPLFVKKYFKGKNYNDYSKCWDDLSRNPGISIDFILKTFNTEGYYWNPECVLNHPQFKSCYINNLFDLKYDMDHLLNIISQCENLDFDFINGLHEYKLDGLINGLDWDYLSKNKHINEDIFCKFMDRWNRFEISKHKFATIDIIEKYQAFEWDIDGLFHNPNLNEEFIIRYEKLFKKQSDKKFSKLNFYVSSNINKNITLEDFETYNVKGLCFNKNLNVKLFELLEFENYIMYENEIGWKGLTINPSLSASFILSTLERCKNLEKKCHDGEVKYFKFAKWRWYWKWLGRNTFANRKREKAAKIIQRAWTKWWYTPDPESGESKYAQQRFKELTND